MNVQEKSNSADVLLQQKTRTEVVLAAWPSLGQLVFQGQALSYWVGRGFEEVRRAATVQDFDPVSVRHGIERLRLGGFSGEVIWEAPYEVVEFEEYGHVIEVLEHAAFDISEEVRAVVDEAEKFPDSDALTNNEGLWSFLPFFTNRAISQRLDDLCPRTSEVLQSLRPNLLFGFSFISVLSGSSTIAPHRGSTSLRQRYHLGVTVPEPNSAKIRVGENWIPWVEGKAFGFNDSIEHEVVNAGVADRVALIVDVWPSTLPEEIISGLLRFPEVLNFGVLGRNSDSSAHVAVND